jgi:hypothetical protein
MTTLLARTAARLLPLFCATLLLACSSGGQTVVEDDTAGQDVVGGNDNGTSPEGCVDADGDGFFVGDDCREGTIVDCNDGEGTIFPGADEICGNDIDEDCSGDDLACEDPCEDLDKDGFLGLTDECTKGNDCDDSDDDIFPGADEVCGNGVDEDCNGEDLVCPPECNDNDKDGFVGKTAECDTGTDCDDADDDIYPGAVEICGNDVDEDCDGKDVACPEECDDNDGDGYGNGADCIDYDCNDGNDKIHPGAQEVCGNGLDDDCVDGDADCPEVCNDEDEDGFGVGGACVVQDCDDSNDQIFPGAVEICGNDIDEDCNDIDDPCCIDEDGDGYGQGDACTGIDCDDTNPDANPGKTEVCGNDVDENCDGEAEECAVDCVDGDKDGYGVGADCAGADCNDNDPEIHPGATDICENGQDEDCSGSDATCPPPNCETDWDCGDQQLCDQANGTCRYAKVWEWYAPTFFVDTDEGGEGLDLPRAVNFDGDWNAANNSGNLANADADAVMYYSFVKTSTHWYLGYYAFFPKRWTSWPLGTKYENTMRGVLVVVEQDGSMYGTPVLLETTTEDTYFQYAPADSDLWGSATIDGEINWDLDFPTDHHPVVYVHSQDHGIWGDDYLWNNVDNWDQEGFPGDSGVVYRFGNVAEEPLLDNDEVYYVMKAVNDELWPRQNDIGAGKLFNEFGHFNYISNTNYKALAPWRFFDSSFPNDPEGEFLWNPADLVRRHFLYGWGAFSYKYIYNPYALKVTLVDLMVKADGGFLDGEADPYINLYVSDGAGYEILALSNFTGLINNWYKDDVPVSTLLDLQTEMGGRNYFYGFKYPGASYFGIQVRDYDGGWSGDEWLMDAKETHYYDFVGQELKDWGKSDSYIKVELP